MLGRCLEGIAWQGTKYPAPRADICVMWEGRPCGKPAVAVHCGRGQCAEHEAEWLRIVAEVTAILSGKAGQ